VSQQSINQTVQWPVHLALVTAGLRQPPGKLLIRFNVRRLSKKRRTAWEMIGAVRHGQTNRRIRVKYIRCEDRIVDAGARMVFHW